MGEWVIRNLDDEIVARLTAMAAVQCQSLEQVLREILIRAVLPDREDLVAEAEAIYKTFSLLPPGMPFADQLIREDRDNDETYR
ncbi:MAG: hypothetical protein HQL87_03690 [Magnetococcales bacterium]|nr:hypothetical protein [Magnetococcales bacterium]